MKKIKRIVTLFLAAIMVLSFAGCGKDNLPSNTEPGSDIYPSSDTEPISETENISDNSETVVYELPAGAESEYALYTTVMDYLNNGFHRNDLNDVYDPVLTAVAIYTRPSDFALELRYDELCALLVKLRGTWSKIQTMLGTYEDIDAFCDAFRNEFPGYMPEGKIESDAELEPVIYKLFQDECPESMQAEIDKNHTSFEKWIDAGVFHQPSNIRDAQNPYSTDQTVWEKMSEDELVISEFEYDEEYAALADSFPPMYFMGIGEYRDEYIHEMKLLYTKIGGRYYLINFTGSVLNA